MTKSRRFKKQYAGELLAIAHLDREAAEALVAANIQRKEIIFFHIEQTIEKAIKGVLCHLEIPVPLVHEISILLDRIPEGVNAPPYADEIADLSQFASIRRYEEGVAKLTDEEITAALKISSAVLSWATEIIEKIGSRSQEET